MEYENKVFVALLKRNSDSKRCKKFQLSGLKEKGLHKDLLIFLDFYTSLYPKFIFNMVKKSFFVVFPRGSPFTIFLAVI